MTEHRSGLEGWSAADPERDWWRRGYDPIGRHTMAAAVLGVLLAALIGAVLDPFNLRTSDDLRRAEQAEYDRAFAAVEAEAYADGVPYGEVERLGAEITGAGVGADTPYGGSFRRGWIAGWNEALAAMRAAALASGLPEGYTEFRVLDELDRR